MPNMVGMLGPYRSASIRPTFAPVDARLTARLTAMVDFPTPPLPDATAIMFFTFSRFMVCGAPCPPPCAPCPWCAPCPPWWLHDEVTFASIVTVMEAASGTDALTASMQDFLIDSFIGQAGVVRTTVNDTFLSLSIAMSRIMPSVTRSLWRSGSITVLSASMIWVSCIIPCKR